VLRVVFELFIVEEQLLASGKHEFRTAVTALQDSVDKFHGRLPQRKEQRSLGHDLESAPVPFPVFDRP
jgi:hypothetical protein